VFLCRSGVGKQFQSLSRFTSFRKRASDCSGCVRIRSHEFFGILLGVSDLIQAEASAKDLKSGVQMVWLQGLRLRKMGERFLRTASIE
jgi:hypothetical protein